MPADPLDKQLVEAVLSRPRRAKADIEEAKLAGLRPSRAKAAVAVADDDDDDDDDDLDLGPDAGDDGADVGVVIVEDDAPPIPPRSCRPMRRRSSIRPRSRSRRPRTSRPSAPT